MSTGTLNTKAELLACIDREIAMRRRLYPQWIAQGKMSKVVSDRELATIQNVRAALARFVPDDPIVQGRLFDDGFDLPR